MVAPTTWLPQLYQRFQTFWERAVPAGGLALLLWVSAEATDTFFFSGWRIFLAVALFLLGLASPRGAYIAFTFLVAAPLYSISIYVAAIILAVLILTSHWAMRNLGAAVLVLIAPALLPWHLEATVPLLAGLWWGELTGALAGGLAALWLKLLAGMAGQPLDLVRLSGSTLVGTDIIARFRDLNSLETLLELVTPFADSSREILSHLLQGILSPEQTDTAAQIISRALLIHLLQVLAWALAGYLAGLLARRIWSDRLRGWAPLLSAVPAGGVLWASYALLCGSGPGMLKQPEVTLTSWGWALFTADNPMSWSFTAALVAAATRQFYLYLRRPLFRPLRRQPQRAPSSPPESLPERKERSLERGSARPTFNWTAARRSRPAAEADGARPADKARPTDDDIIMLEID